MWIRKFISKAINSIHLWFCENETTRKAGRLKNRIGMVEVIVIVAIGLQNLVRPFYQRLPKTVIKIVFHIA